MAVREDHAEVRAPKRWRWLRWMLVGVAASVLVLAALAAYVLGVFTRHASPYEALDAYTSAVASGDRDALSKVIADGRGREALIERHAGKRMVPTSVSMETTVSGVWWSVEVRYDLPGQPPNSEHLLVHPRDDSPDRLMDYVVAPAP